jgi:hypothetical protein
MSTLLDKLYMFLMCFFIDFTDYHIIIFFGLKEMFENWSSTMMLAAHDHRARSCEVTCSPSSGTLRLELPLLNMQYRRGSAPWSYFFVTNIIPFLGFYICSKLHSTRYLKKLHKKMYNFSIYDFFYPVATHGY